MKRARPNPGGDTPGGRFHFVVTSATVNRTVLSLTLVGLLHTPSGDAAGASPSAAARRSARKHPYCATLLCQQRALADSAPEEPVPAGGAEALAVASVSFGIGAAAFAVPDHGVERFTTGEGVSNVFSDLPDDSQGVVGAPALSATVFLQQPLLESGGLHLHLEEHFSLLALRPLVGDDGNAFAGLAEFLLGVRAPEGPLSFAVGVTTGVSRLDLANRFIETEYLLMLGAAVVVRYDLQDMPGVAVNVIGRIGTLFPEGSYNDGQLALSLEL